MVPQKPVSESPTSNLGTLASRGAPSEREVGSQALLDATSHRILGSAGASWDDRGEL